MEDSMRKDPDRVCGCAVVCLVIALAISSPSWATVPDGFRDIKLGMNKVQVMEILTKGSIHFSYDDRGNEIGEIVRGDNMFRYATYRFDKDNVLVEIGLQMREVIGRDKVLEQYNSTYGLNVSLSHRIVEANRSVEVKGNGLIIRIEPGHLSLRNAR
jgi:hypothetical protein